MSNKTMDFFFCILKSCCLSTAKIQNDICKRKNKKKHFLPNAKYLKRLVNRIMLQVKLLKLERLYSELNLSLITRRIISKILTDLMPGISRAIRNLLLVYRMLVVL